MKPNFLSRQLRGQIIKVLWITLFWILVSMLQYANGYGTLLYFGHDLSELNANLFFYASLITGSIAGLLGGSSMVFFWERWLRTISYRRSLFYIIISYSLVFIIVAIISHLYNYALQNNLSVFDPEVIASIGTSMPFKPMLFNYLFWLAVVLITLIALLVNDKYGPGVFADFLLGKYFHPRKEERIFMFLDLRNSTGIAEVLGEQRYFNFIRQVYKDITPAILSTEGEVYQYVGDEVVISWLPKAGMRNSNAIMCFFQIQETLLSRSAFYEQHYDGIRPEFKAGLHYGNVMAGEVGVIKREIAYSGDVLNTTARIQSKCNELGVNLLISKPLVDFLTPLTKANSPREIGDISLRGKQQSVKLYTLTN